MKRYVLKYVFVFGNPITLFQNPNHVVSLKSVYVLLDGQEVPVKVSVGQTVECNLADEKSGTIVYMQYVPYIPLVSYFILSISIDVCQSRSDTH